MKFNKQVLLDYPRVTKVRIKRIMVCLDGSKQSLKGLDEGIKLAKNSEAMIIGVFCDTTFGAFTAIHTPTIKEEKWSKEIQTIIENAKKITIKREIDFEGIVIAGHTAGYDLTVFANNPKNKIDYIIVGARGNRFPKELFLGSTSNFILHKAKAPVIVVR